MSRGEEFHQAAGRRVTWDHVVAANTGPHGRWNGADDGEVEDAVQRHLGVSEHEAAWTHERVPLAELKSGVVPRFAGQHYDGEDCPHCYSHFAALAGPPVAVVHDGQRFHTPDGRHRISGAYANGETHIDAFVARRPQTA